ncbi:unnamed protein product [Cyclocybe aegerita]|uniref:NGN domain-containing protein n=1 Tax=Cyclocybe aegerita TaxID=1973307 RepID=A0A8S0W0J6_CYCAE|nr:unnamed protein product [Cyclocybe aegerita]
MAQSRSYAATAPTHVESSDDLAYIAGRLLSTEDYPLWRVGCRLGLEEEAMFLLLLKVREEHQIRSAFTCGSLRGWVYLEALMNPNLIHLLERTPRIIHTKQGIVQHGIKPSDWLRMLTMTNPDTSVEVNQWVRVRKGIYRGDVGLVVKVESWGVEVLLVPHLAAPIMEPSLKRKQSVVPPKPALFEPNVIKYLYDINPIQKSNRSYTFRGLHFEHRLLQKHYDFHSLASTAVDMPSYFFLLFKASDHPSLHTSRFPRPREWIFEQGERVIIRSSGKSGVVAVIGTNNLEVDLGAENGKENFPWSDIQKDVRIGDSLPLQADNSMAQQDTDLSSSLKEFEVHQNWLKVTTAPFLYASRAPSQVLPLFKDQVPWISTSVTIFRIGHPYKGHSGVVKNVLRSQPTDSGLRIEMQLTYLDPSKPFPLIIVDYGDVIETITALQLFNYAKPTSMLFKLNDYKPWPALLQVSTSGGPTRTPAPATPGWSPSLQPISSTPAWDPSSRTLISSPMSPITTTSSTTLPLQELPHHLLLDPCLVGTTLKIIVNSGSYSEELSVTIDEVDGQVSIRHVVYNKLTGLPPEWVSPKHLNATHDNGLLVVVKGKHCSKYVQQIHHRHHDGQVLMNLAVVRRSPSTADTLLDKQLELTMDFLCVGSESKEEKKLNSSLMTSLQDDVRKLAHG